MILANSPVTEHKFNHHRFFLKRDDLLHPQFSGNKARKFMALLDIPSNQYQKIISYGSAQSNAMYSLSALAQLKGWQFEFYVQHLPRWLKENPIGNYRAALDMGINIYSMQELGLRLHPSQYLEQLKKTEPKAIFIPEGGRASISEIGVQKLAQEIIQWVKDNNINSCTVALPSGTGTTALYLQKHLKIHDINVITCACVADSEYLIKQFFMLEKEKHPTILSLDKKHHFGRLYSQDYDIWLSLLSQTQIEFDLLYDPYMWRCLIPWLEQNKNQTLLYIHQGGLLGNESMQPRYERWRKEQELAKNNI